MRALTVRQPWASLLMLDDAQRRKVWETRGFRPRCISLGDEIAIHAGRRVDVDAIDLSVLRALGAAFGVMPGGYPSLDASRRALASRLPTGQIIGISQFGNCARCEDIKHSRRFGDFSDGRFGWLLRPTLRLTPGVRCRGALGLWIVPPDIERYLLESRGR